MPKKYSIYIAFILIVSMLVACGSNSNNTAEKSNDDTDLNVSKDELVPKDEVVVVINDSDVLGETYNMVYAQLKLHASQTGQEVGTDKLKKAALDSVIDRELLMQQAEEEGITISNEEATQELDRLKEENEQNLNTILEQYHMTEADFKEQLRFELTLGEYKQKAIDVSVSDDEIEEYYKEAKENNEEMPDLDDIRSDLKAQMTEQKSNEALQKKIDEVKDTSTIEKKLEA